MGGSPLGTFLKNFKTTQDIEMIFFYFNFVSLKVILHILIALIVLRYSPGNLLIFNRGGRGDRVEVNRFWINEGKVIEKGGFRPLQSERLYIYICCNTKSYPIPEKCGPPTRTALTQMDDRKYKKLARFNIRLYQHKTV